VFFKLEKTVTSLGFLVFLCHPALGLRFL